MFGEPGPELLVPGVTSAHARARLVTCPERRRADGSPVRVEVRPVPLADRVRYVGLIALADEDEGPPPAELYPALVIPACWSPAFDTDGVWQPHVSTLRVFRPGDDDVVLGLPQRRPQGDRQEQAGARPRHAPEGQGRRLRSALADAAPL